MTSSVATAEGTDRKLVYILILEGDNFYVGATNQLESRIDAHQKGSGARWTDEHPVVEIAGTSSMISKWKELEKEVTLRMMERFGWENVRGGPWTQVELENPPQAIQD